ncbi:MAG: 5-oxoprolinase subunit PxpB [Selenomonadaceae bacterium]|nr:5-oxoprolinase subunit PxpB [Selenomonadaceae bacterium]
MSARFLPAGDSAIAVEFGREIDLNINNQVAAMRTVIEAAIDEGKLKGIVELVPTYGSLLVVYDQLAVGYAGLIEQLKILAEGLKGVEIPDREVVEIPVVYGGEYGPDLGIVAQLNSLSEDEVIKRHSEAEYPIYMLGFVAGFPYLGGMDKSIAAPRKQTPRLKIPAGSVGIAGQQTGIYSVESPGGWQIIGRTPLKLYDADGEKPILLRAGQSIRFKPITEAEYEAMTE